MFNDKGIEIQSFTYNSLDPSSKFHTENEVDEQGRTLAAFDESGEHKTTFDYERDGVTVKTERLPNGSKFSYGRDKDGTVTAITHSTENGEENSTTQTRTLDVVTEVKSGNNTVRYEYNKKHRVKSVLLNVVDNYVTYTYIISCYEYAITAKPTTELHLLDCTCKLYTYDDNSDQLMSYNGEEFVYDIIGNPTTYRGKTAVWEYGRQLKSYDGNTFTYDARGRRTSKNDITFSYDSNGNLIKQSNGLEFLYDHTGVFAVNTANNFVKK